jgi:Tol biopolymer transport system component
MRERTGRLRVLLAVAMVLAALNLFETGQRLAHGRVGTLTPPGGQPAPPPPGEEPPYALRFLTHGGAPTPALSGDGRTAAWFSEGRLWACRLPDGEPQALLTGDGREENPRVLLSRDGRRLVYSFSQAGDPAEASVRLWDLRLGPQYGELRPRVIARRALPFWGLALSPDGRYLAAAVPFRLFRLDDQGNEVLIYTSEDEEAHPDEPQWSPDSRHLLIHQRPDQASISEGTTVILTANGRVRFRAQGVRGDAPFWHPSGAAVVFYGFEGDDVLHPATRVGYWVYSLPDDELRYTDLLNREQAVGSPWGWAPDGTEFSTTRGLWSAVGVAPADRALLRVSWPGFSVLQRVSLANVYVGRPGQPVAGPPVYSPRGDLIAMVAGWLPNVARGRTDILLFRRDGGWTNLTEASEYIFHGLVGWVDDEHLLVTVAREAAEDRQVAVLRPDLQRINWQDEPDERVGSGERGAAERH